MGERERYQEWLKGQQERGLMMGQAAEHFGGEGWKARADLASEREQRLVEALNRLHAASTEYRRCCELLGAGHTKTVQFFTREVVAAEEMAAQALVTLATYDQTDDGGLRHE